LGLEESLLLFSLATPLALGAWLYAHCHQEVEFLLGTTALVARIWTYHRLCDVLLMMLPMVSFSCIANRGPRDRRRGRASEIVPRATLLSMLPRARPRCAPWPPHIATPVGRTLAWAAVLVLLVLLSGQVRT